MSKRSVVHATFTLERTFEASPERVFRAFAIPKQKQRWFAEGEGWVTDEFTMDFRVGGREVGRFRFKDGPEVRNDTVYQDIVENERIISAYVMTIGGNRISASLATITIEAVKDGSRVIYTEQGTFLDGHDTAAQREAGTKELFDKLGEELDKGM